MHSRNLALMLISLLMTTILLAAQSAPATKSKPISQQGLTEALRIGGLTTQELIDIVKERGVVFQVTEQVEADLRAAGAPPPLVKAVRENYRPPVAEPRPAQLGPLSKNEIITLLQVGTPSPRIEQIISQRGVNFPLTPAITSELTNAGAESGLLTTIEAAWAKSAAASSSTQTQTAAPPGPAGKSELEAATPTRPGPRLSSIKEVRKLYIEKMKNNLDQYMRAEVSKQLPGRFLLVLAKDEADAIMVGSGKEKTDTGSVLTGRLGLSDTASGAVSIVDKAGTVLWASEAGDRTFLFGPLKRGGPREVASRLVQDLKRSLQSED